jgi:hypothetical protein
MMIAGDLSSAQAEAEISTIHLQNGGTIRGEIVVDVPGSPLTVMVAGQAMQITRDTIASIERPAPANAAPAADPAAAPAPAPAAAPVYAAPPVYSAAPVYARPPVAAAPAVAAAPVSVANANWSPEAQQLVLQRNEVAYRMKRQGLGSAITLMAVGAIAVVSTAVATTLIYNNYTQCVAGASNAYDYGNCDNSAPLGMGVGYGLGSALLAGGTTFMIVRIVKRKALQRRLAVIDNDLRRFNVAPVARLNMGGGMAGLSLRTSF